MNRSTLKRLIDGDVVKRAIEEAEGRSSGEIRVSVSTFFWGNVRHTAEQAFARMGMDQTAARNGVLVFVVPSRRTFVVLGDEGIHAKVGQPFWDAVAAAMSARFKAGDFTGGLVLGITEAGKQLAEHFPHEGARDRNELSDDVDFGHDPHP
ncbi:MAG: TPM domain-containing protein [Vicinamibacterales bacterium]|nr:TPM domain-containing protein [Vicinamibacterales bacterium]